MAMDKERLMSYFQTHYLSRQEVLYKLPLNVSIDSFWNELLSRRKARAAVLPLNNAAGMPYWYVLTDRMVAASERLCEEAIGQDSSFDPYRAGMTSAMTEEMFFTSFVEGAQIPLQEAMDFLQRGTEPESIQEQMIWNNRRAWAEMMGTLYRPLDEGFVRSLAFILTEEMDNCAEDYRQTDQHPIAAMNNEEYVVPPAYSLPDRMGEYYAFLRKPDVHPLIRAAAAQAYLLVTRPFPEGNERLSRMMSSAVLLRSGYDFFRDISVSSVIARESYRYYKCMCEIIRMENGGDMTYFMEYYLELLVRALEARNERARRREQEALERDREMARAPLRPAVQPAEEDIEWEAQDDDDPDKPPRRPPGAREQGAEEPAEASGDGRETDVGVKTSDPDSLFANKALRMLPPVPLMEPRKYLEAVGKMRSSRYGMIREMPDKIKRILAVGLLRFTTAQWAEILGVSRKNADYECRYMYEKGWMTRDKEGGVYVYCLRVTNAETTANDSPVEYDDMPLESGSATPPANSYFEAMLRRMEASTSAFIRQTAVGVRDMRVQSVYQFTRKEWMDFSGMDKEKASNACDYLVAHRLIRNISNKRTRAVYVFSDIHAPSGPDTTFASQPDWVDHTSTIPPSLIRRLEEMAVSGETEVERRIGEILIKNIRNGVATVTAEDFEKAYGLKRSSSGKILRIAVNLGLISNSGWREKNGRATYNVNPNPQQGIRESNLTKNQKEILYRLYTAFHKQRFTTADAAKVCNAQNTGFGYHMKNFVACGVLKADHSEKKPTYYKFSITPEEYPQCFLQEEIAEQRHVSSGIPTGPVPMVAAGR